jgi:hypothetical protein
MKYIVEYSESQKAFHIGEESEILEKEILAFEKTGWVGDYKVIGRFQTYEAASAFLDEYRQK